MSSLTDERLQQINEQTVDRTDMFYWQTNRPMTIEECGIIFGESRKDVSDKELGDLLVDALSSNPDYQDAKANLVAGGEQYTIGSVNINRKFVLQDGREVVGRFHPRGLKNGYFSVEAEVADLAANHGIPVAKPLAVHYAADVQGLDFIVFEKVPGNNVKYWIEDHPEDEPKLVFAMGALMARIHAIKVDGYGFFDNDLARSQGILKGIHTNYRDHILAGLPADLQEIIGADYINHEQADAITKLLQNTTLTDCTDPCLVHNDLADWNVMTDGTNVTAIDWDEAHAGDPVADIACWSLFFPSARLEKFLNGYKSVSELPHNFDEKLHIYRLRYLVSKLALRHKKYFYDKSLLMENLISAGREAFADEVEHFGLTS